MSRPNTQICVSNRVKQILDRRRRADESYNDVLERLLIDEMSDPVSLHRKRARLRRRAWLRRLSTDDINLDE